MRGARTLVWRPINKFTQALELRENGVSGGGPYERATTEIVLGDIGVDLLHELFDAAEGAAPNGLLGDETEPALHLIKAGPAARTELHTLQALHRPVLRGESARRGETLPQSAGVDD